MAPRGRRCIELNAQSTNRVPASAGASQARADKLLEDGDAEGAAIWRAVKGAIEELQRGRREAEPLN
jgi:hypothetical protein